MAFHVNPNTGKRAVCRAKHKCRFGGESGQENHFSTAAEADLHAEKVMTEKYHTFDSSQKDSLSELNRPEAITQRSKAYKETSKIYLQNWAEEAATHRATTKRGSSSPAHTTHSAVVKDIHQGINSWVKNGEAVSASN